MSPIGKTGLWYAVGVGFRPVPCIRNKDRIETYRIENCIKKAGFSGPAFFCKKG